MGEKARLASAGSEIKLWEMPGLVMTNSMSLHSQPISSICWGNNSILLWFLFSFCPHFFEGYLRYTIHLVFLDELAFYGVTFGAEKLVKV